MEQGLQRVDGCVRYMGSQGVLQGPLRGSEGGLILAHISEPPYTHGPSPAPPIGGGSSTRLARGFPLPYGRPGGPLKMPYWHDAAAHPYGNPRDCVNAMAESVPCEAGKAP